MAERIHPLTRPSPIPFGVYRTAVNERRTVVLSLPLDVQSSFAPDTLDSVRLQEPARLRPDPSAVEHLVELLQQAERPVFVAGRGGRGRRKPFSPWPSMPELWWQPPRWPTGYSMAKPSPLGIYGGFSSPVTAELISGADLIVGWGCTLNMWTMRHGRLISPGTKVVQVDVEDASLGANRPISLGVLGDSALAMDALALLKAAGRLQRKSIARRRTQ